MNRADLRSILDLVKEKLARDVEAACGLFWEDEREPPVTTHYAVGEEDCNTDYAVGECDDEDPVVRYGVQE